MSKTAILQAVQRLDLEATRRLLDSRPGLLGVTDRQGRNLLHLACSASPAKLALPAKAQVRFAEFLLERGLAIDEPLGKDACTPLFLAVARARNRALVARLIECGAKVAAAPGGGLFAAGWWEDLAILRLLVRDGARVDIVVGVTPFLACWCWRRFDAARCLAQLGADLNFQDDKGRTALHHGIEKGFEPVLLRWLVSRGASPDIPDHRGVTPRVRASRQRRRRYTFSPS